MADTLSTSVKNVPVRTFLAVELPDNARASLEAVNAALRPASELKVVAPALLHVTIRFLGPVTSDRLPEVEEAARDAAVQAQPFTLRMTGLGAFPNERSPRVLWAGLSDDAGLASLRRLYAALEDELDARGFGREGRSFSPHITLARARDPATGEDRRRIGELLARVRAEHPVDVSFRVPALTVMRSDLKPSGPIYTPMARAGLAPA